MQMANSEVLYIGYDSYELEKLRGKIVYFLEYDNISVTIIMGRH